jgi:hypothetical protein
MEKMFVNMLYLLNLNNLLMKQHQNLIKESKNKLKIFQEILINNLIKKKKKLKLILNKLQMD